MPFTSMTVRLEDQSWADAQLAIIAQDHHLLKSFQTLKYVNSKFFANQTIWQYKLLTRTFIFV